MPIGLKGFQKRHPQFNTGRTHFKKRHLSTQTLAGNKKISEANKGNKSALGKHWKQSEETINKKRREKNGRWLGGISFEPYSPDWTHDLREFIRERDNYTDPLTGQYGNCVHHIDYDKKNCDPKNLITLSNSSNSRVNKNREYWTKYFNNLITKGGRVKA